MSAQALEPREGAGVFVGQARQCAACAAGSPGVRCPAGAQAEKHPYSGPPMSSTGWIALIAPVLPACLLALSLRAKGALDALAPALFATLIGGAALAASVGGTASLAGAVGTVLLAIAGLLIAIARKDGLLRHAHYHFDWEKFERDLQFYSIIAGLR
jgi:hypothetical protein